MKGEQIIMIWNETKDALCDLSRNDHYVGNIIARKGFKVTNSIFDSCWFRKQNVVMHIMKDVDTNEWVLTEYIGLRGDATRIRYIKAEKEYELDIN